MRTIAAIATPPGRSGVGVIRISGPAAPDIARAMCSSDGEFPPRQAIFSSWVGAAGEPIDSGLTLFFPAPNSYTGDDVIELQAHGSPVLLRLLLERTFALGAEPAEPGEFTRQAVENGKMDLSQAEAVIAAIDAATERAARQAQRHLQGEFGRAIERLMNRITGVVAHVEACLDFPEEEVPPLFMERLRAQVESEIVGPIRQMLATSGFGERLFDGAVVAIVGAPNVGKSSLLNALAGRERAIVSDIPGTTRDVLEVDFEVHGIPVRLADTAGIRESADQIEQEGVRRAHAAAASADVVLFVADAIRPESWQHPGSVDLSIMNKCDLVDVALPEGFIPVSAREGTGLDLLRDRLATLLGEDTIGEEGLLVTRARHRQALERALDGMEGGTAMLGVEERLDLVALEWRRGWSALAAIIGMGDVEDILDRIFADFCIGK